MFDKRYITIILSLKDRIKKSKILKQLVEFIKNIDEGDVVYLDDTASNTRAKAVQSLSNYPFKKTLKELLKAINATSHVSQDNVVFIISDDKDHLEEFDVKKMVNKNLFIYKNNEDDFTKLCEKYDVTFKVINLENDLFENILEDYYALGDEEDAISR